MNNREIQAPKPEVQHLPTIFRKIRTGNIRIPPFQRGFVWQDKQVVELLESVYRGYPVGSILLWHVTSPVFKNEAIEESSFPAVEESYPTTYVLDGMQRLSTLYGVFHYDGSSKQKVFNIGFDLAREKFFNISNTDEKSRPEHFIALSHLFNPKMLMQAQSDLRMKSGGDDLIDKTIFLYSVFQEYMLPTVTIMDRVVEDVVSIFERINNTGVRLGVVDFMRAATWSNAFDLTHEMQEIDQHLSLFGFSLEQETLVKLLGIALSREPSLDRLLTLRDCSSQQLHNGIERVNRALSALRDFLGDRFNIYSFDYVPYEGQTLALANVFIKHDSLRVDQLDYIERWMWATGFNEFFRGRPDDFVIKNMKLLEDAVAGTSPAVSIKLSTEVDDVRDRPFQRKAALSSSIAALFSVGNARSLVTGSVIDPSDYMTEFRAVTYQPILTPELMREVVGTKYYTARLISNIVVANDEDRHALSRGGILDAVLSAYDRFGDTANEILMSQFIPPGAVAALRNRDYSAFLDSRANCIFEAATRRFT